MPYQHVIFVEGDDDLHAIGHLLDQHGISACIFDEKTPEVLRDTIAIKSIGGYPKLRQTLPVELEASSELQRAGVVVDANSNPVDRWQSLSQRINEAGGQEIPALLPVQGWIGEAQVQDRTLDVGAWLMPDNQAPGAIEEFAVHLMPANNSLWTYAEECVAGLAEVMDATRFEQLPKSKARVHTWLAWQKEPGIPVGAAIRNHVFDPYAKAANNFVAWVRRLFGL